MGISGKWLAFEWCDHVSCEGQRVLGFSLATISSKPVVVYAGDKTVQVMCKECAERWLNSKIPTVGADRLS